MLIEEANEKPKVAPGKVIETHMVTKDDFGGSGLDMWAAILGSLYDNGDIEYEEEPDMVEIAVLAPKK